MKIAIVGANSYIARNMIFLLYDKGLEEEQIQLYLYDIQETQLDGREAYTQVDVLDAVSVKKINFEADILFLFTGKTGTTAGFSDYKAFIDLNETALLNLLTEYVDRKSHAKIVYPSTRLVYKGGLGKLYEDSEKQFLTVYAVNKYVCEQYLEIYRKMYDIRYIILRICVPYGTMVPGVSSYGTTEFMLKKAQNREDITLFGSGEVRRTITHIEDLCEMMLRSACLPSCLNDIYNVGGEDYSLLEMAEQIAEKYSVGVVFVEWPEQAYKIESGSTVFASDRLDARIQYRCRHTFKGWIDGLNRYDG